MTLNAAQQATLQQFKDVTNWPQSEGAAISLLESCDWNVETAVMLHFDGGAAAAAQVPTATATASPTTRSERISLAEELNSLRQESDIAPTGISPDPRVYSPAAVPSFIQTFLLAPLNLGYKVFNTIFYMLSYIFPFMPRLTGYYPANRNARLAEGSIDPRNTAIRYIRWFEETYNVTLTEEDGKPGSSAEKKERLIPFYEGGYSEALERAKKDLKYLVVYLQSDEHELTDEFNKNVLLSPIVRRLLNREDVIFWAGTVRESEAYLVSSGLEVSKFPFVGVIAPTPKTATSNSVVMSVLLRIQGCGSLSAEQFLSIVEEKLESHSPKLMALVFDKQEREASRRILEEQNSAYERSLAQDRERERQKRETVAKKEREDQDRRTKEQQFISWKQWKASQIRSKLAAAASTNEKTARLSIRLLNGERVIKKFGAGDTIDDIYGYVQCQDLVDGEAELLDNERPAYVHKYDFQLVSPMPRKIMTDLSMAIKDEKSLWPNGNLVVEEEE